MSLFAWAIVVVVAIALGLLIGSLANPPPCSVKGCQNLSVYIIPNEDLQPVPFCRKHL